MAPISFHAYKRSNSWVVSHSRLEESMHDYGLEADIISYNSAMSASQKSSRWRLALYTLHSLAFPRGLQLDGTSYGTATSSCAKASRWSSALALFAQHFPPGARPYGVRPDVVLCSAGADAFGAGGRWEEVIGLLPAMSQQGIGPNAFTLSSTVAACGRRQQWLKALLLHAAARREAAEAAVPTPSELVGAGVGALARAECWCPGAEGRGPAVRQGRQDAGHLLQSLQLARGAIASVVASNAALGGAGGVVGGWSWALGLFAGLALPDHKFRNSDLRTGIPRVLVRTLAVIRFQLGVEGVRSGELLGWLSRRGLWPPEPLALVLAALAEVDKGRVVLQHATFPGPTTASFQAVIDALDRGTKRTRSECDARRGVQTDGKGGLFGRIPGNFWASQERVGCAGVAPQLLAEMASPALVPDSSEDSMDEAQNLVPQWIANEIAPMSFQGVEAKATTSDPRYNPRAPQKNAHHATFREEETFWVIHVRALATSSANGAYRDYFGQFPGRLGDRQVGAGTGAGSARVVPMDAEFLGVEDVEETGSWAQGPAEDSASLLGRAGRECDHSHPKPLRRELGKDALLLDCALAVHERTAWPRSLRAKHRPTKHRVRADSLCWPMEDQKDWQKLHLVDVVVGRRAPWLVELQCPPGALFWSPFQRLFAGVRVQAVNAFCARQLPMAAQVLQALPNSHHRPIGNVSAGGETSPTSDLKLNKDQRWLPPSLKAHTKLKLFNLWFYHSQRLLAVEQRQQEQAASVNG
ncbi:unnamed protein product [Durusdinium trenchii]|uniref:Uncharacterized protein n=1 Tax=Durusdinium trenchii TaxID=1381693 RepID=A0ABP0I5D3_9DINO